MGDEKASTMSLVETHLQHILYYIGITELYFFAIDGTSDENLANQKMKMKKIEIINLLNR